MKRESEKERATGIEAAQEERKSGSWENGEGTVLKI